MKRWLVAPLELSDGTLQPRDRGTPQGSAVSPVLANLVLHYAFDTFLAREFPTVDFQRYADDAVIHCVTERQAREVRAALQVRLSSLGLELHPDKTRIVYCQDDDRRGAFEHTSFTFLGYTFTPRAATGRGGKPRVSFLPAVSNQALARMSGQLRRWRLHQWTTHSLDQLADGINPVMRGWMNYYGRFHRSRLFGLLRRINTYLMRWAAQKYKRLRIHRRRHAWWTGILDRNPRPVDALALGTHLRLRQMRRAE